jgi:predicted NAD/FAD-dependent oxidoreductase
MMSRHIIRTGIIGAGITGLSCARELQAYGFDVEVFEKSRGLGGRTSTRRSDSGLRFDHGAQFFTASTLPFQAMTSDWLTRGIVAEWTGRVVDIEGGNVVEASPQVRYVGVPGMSAMAADLGVGLRVKTGMQVIGVRRTPSGWMIETEDHQNTEPFDMLVVTLPAPQSAELLAAYPFTQVASSVQMAPCWAVMVAFKSQVNVPWDGAFIKRSPLAWVARNSSKPGRDTKTDCWVLHADPSWTAAHLETSAEITATELLNAFEAVIGGQLPTHSHLVAHRWRYSRGADPENRQMLLDLENRVIVCGDWLSGGTIEHAFLAGIHTANAIRTMNLHTEESAIDGGA